MQEILFRGFFRLLLPKDMVLFETGVISAWFFYGKKQIQNQAIYYGPAILVHPVFPSND